LRKGVRDAHPGTDELEKIERRLAAAEDVAELARQIFSVVRVEVERLEVVAEVHRPERGRSARKLRQRDTQRQCAEDPVELRELAAPVVFFAFGEVF